MRKSVKSSFVQACGLQIPLDTFFATWAANGRSRKIERLPFKFGANSWNDGPTAMKPKECFALWNLEGGREWICCGVFEVWERADGYSKQYYQFDDIEDYQAFKPNDESPLAIKNEIGLCKNYHKGI